MSMITVIIVNYNAGDRLQHCLESLERQSFRDFETIVIDNASSDGSAQRAQAAGGHARFIAAGANLGFAAANNLAARSAVGEWLAFLNPDACAGENWLAALVAAAGRYPDVEAFGSTQLTAENPDVIDGAGDVYHAFGIPYRGYFGWPASALPPEGECFAPCAAAAMYRRSVFEALGGFDEQFFCYGEDVDLGFRHRLSGGRAVQVREAVVLHEGSGITGRHSDFSIYHGHRNRIWLTYKNVPALIYWPLWPLRRLVDFLYLLARARSAGIEDPLRRALRDGYRGLAALREVRRHIQKGRKASLGAIAAAMTWSPFKIATREGSIRPLSRLRARARAAARR